IAQEQVAERTGQAETLFACLIARPRPAPPAAKPEPTFDQARLDTIEGWLFPEAIDLTARLVRWQHGMGVAGGVLELGVYMGKYLGLLASLSQGTGMPVVGVDAYTNRVGEQHAQADRDFARDTAVANIVGMAPAGPPPTLLVAFTADVDAPTLRALSPGGYSFISVDAAHVMEDVGRDLLLVEALMGEHTIVAADDAFSAPLPGVSEALFRHFIGQPDRLMAPVAWAGNKLFLCHRARHPATLAHLHRLIDDADAPGYLQKTRVVRQHNRDVAFTPMLFGYEMIGFSWT
ncbi:MAG: hypothetical protein H7Z10_14220, partial [Gemmatimonadaceae bacterium]|nr:hypothetical protein [Acetobacteraceae bacterium]